MQRLAFAILAAFALVAAAPAFADDDGCKNCPAHKKELAQATEKKEKEAAKPCPCAGGKECKCGEGCKCECSHCHKDKKAEEKKAT